MELLIFRRLLAGPSHYSYDRALAAFPVPPSWLARC